MGEQRNRGGFTLLELLICVFIIGMIALGLERVLASALSSQTSVQGKQELLADARAAMERMVMFVQETDAIDSPLPGEDNEQCVLKVRERVADSDWNGVPDADRNGNGIIEETEKDYVVFDVNETKEIREKLPDYSGAPGSLLGEKVICGNVEKFRCVRHLNNLNLVKLYLTVDNGKARVALETRARARLVQ